VAQKAARGKRQENDIFLKNLKILQYLGVGVSQAAILRLDPC
jgi:hypothetical protein